MAVLSLPTYGASPEPVSCPKNADLNSVPPNLFLLGHDYVVVVRRGSVGADISSAAIATPSKVYPPGRPYPVPR